METTISIKTPIQILKAKLSDYAQLIKMRLSFLVVFSAAMAYLWATHRNVDTLSIWMLSIGGFFITGSANTFNQIIERESDKLMKRTANRPLATERMQVSEALILALILGISGLYILSQINSICVVLGAVAMFIYICIYTPLKKITWLSVVPGAIAGSLPVVIGCAAATGAISRETLFLFLIQFIWQFPHTWSIAWLLSDEYNKAGIKMLPTSEKSKTSAILILLSTFLIIPTGLLLYMYESSGIHVTWMIALAGIIMLLFAFRFYKLRTDKSAVSLMLSCFAYLPIVLIILVAENFL
ncbi:MAG: protoheme IX farnesyltransferase [Bacteroidetes bacterium]|nr:protoheme IX farnesyltransferase [Bacteroidota bacterium]